MVEPRLYTTSTASEGTVEISSRNDAVSTVAQLHSDHGNLLQSYRHVIVPSVDPKCPKCGEDQHTLLRTEVHSMFCTGNYSATSLSNPPSPSRWLTRGLVAHSVVHPGAFHRLRGSRPDTLLVGQSTVSTQ